MSKNPFDDLQLPHGMRTASDAYVNITALLAQREDLQVGYADIVAGLLHAMPAILAMSESCEASLLMAERVQKYVGAPEFRATVARWFQAFVDAADEIERGATASDDIVPASDGPVDLARDPRFN